MTQRGDKVIPLDERLAAIEEAIKQTRRQGMIFSGTVIAFLLASHGPDFLGFAVKMLGW